MGPKILIVDDHEPTLEATVKALNKEFQPVPVDPYRPALSSQSCWNEDPQLKLAAVDLLLKRDASPHHLNEGFALIGAFKRRPGSRIAVHSNYATHEELACAVELGADAFIDKTWKRDRFLSHIRLMADQHRMVTLMAGDVPTRERPGRAVEFCRAIVAHLPIATPDRVYLVALLLAAELHDRGRLGRPTTLWPHVTPTPADRVSLEQHVARAREIAALGGGYREVGRILHLHHRRFRPTRNPELPNFPAEPMWPEDPALGWGDALPLEARILQVAEAFDSLITESIPGFAFAPTDAVDRLAEAAETGDYDPEVVTALRRFVYTPSEWRSRLLK